MMGNYLNASTPICNGTGWVFCARKVSNTIMLVRGSFVSPVGRLPPAASANAGLFSQDKPAEWTACTDKCLDPCEKRYTVHPKASFSKFPAEGLVGPIAVSGLSWAHWEERM